jgi:hypothetical protein
MKRRDFPQELFDIIYTSASAISSYFTVAFMAVYGLGFHVLNAFGSSAMKGARQLSFRDTAVTGTGYYLSSCRY